MAARPRWAIRSAPAAPRCWPTLLSALQQRGGKRGLASLCIGGGEATAMAVELV
jgi:hypothetical protein